MMFTLALILGMASAIVWPAIDRAAMSAELAQTVSNGANIYKAAFASQMDSLVLGGDQPVWPQKGQYRTSTEYFIELVESGTLNVTYDFFAAPGLPAARSSDPRDFKAENNAWRMVLGLDNAPPGTPFLFTRNYDPDALRADDDPIVLNDEPPFGTNGLVVVLSGGAAFFLKGDQLRNSFFNPPGTLLDHGLEIVGP